MGEFDVRAPPNPSHDAQADVEQALVDAARVGDPAAFTALYESFFPRVYGYVRRRVAAEADAEDVTQDALVEVFRGLAGFRGEAPFGGWVFSIVKRVLARHHSRRGPGEGVESAAEVPSREPTPEQRVHARGLLRHLEETLRRLHPRGLRALELRFVHGLSTREVGARLGCTEDGVKGLVRRLRRDLNRSAAAQLQNG
jgi:RNA polymerase sigma-70 factor (ECF subfamily)